MSNHNCLAPKRDGRSGRGLIVVTSFAFNETVST